MPQPLLCRHPAADNSAQLYEILVKELTDFVVFQMDPTGCVVSWNPGVERILGYGEAEWLGQSAEVIFTPEDRAQGVLQGEMTKAAREGRSPDIRWHRRKNGERLYTEGAMVALRDETGQLLGFSKIMRDITEGKKQEEALRQQRQQRQTFETVLSRSPDHIATFDLTGRFTYANHPVLALYRQSPEEIVGKNFFDLPCPPELAERLQRQIQQVIDSRQPVRDDTPFVDPITRETQHYEYNFVPVLAESGQVEAVAGSSRDITERCRMKTAQRASEQRFQALIAASSDVLYRMSPDWMEMRQLGGGGFLPDTESPNPNWLQEYIHPDDQPLILKAIQTAVRTKSVFELEHRVRRVDGTLGWTHSRAIPVFDAGGEIVEWFGAATDITARKEAETEREQLLQQINAERQRLEQVFLQAPVAIAVYRGDQFVVELANPSYQALLHGRDLVGWRLADVVPEVEPEVWNPLRHVFDTGQPFALTNWHVPYDQDRDGTVEDHWFNGAYTPLCETDGTVSGLIVVLTEVTAQEQARQELERTNRELARANRELEEFAYVTSHDLQEPLRMVNIYSQLMLKERQGDPARLDQYADFVRRGVHRMEELLRDLLEFSRTVQQDELPAEKADLSQALSEAVSVLHHRIEESGATVRAPALPTVRGDTKQLAHVFQNLIGNSLKYRHPDRVPDISISAEREGPHWKIAVRDNGMGFEPQYAQQIFGLFKRLHRDEYPGTGLGLAICQRIIERYGGRMWAEGQPGAGATFYFSLTSGEEQGA